MKKSEIDILDREQEAMEKIKTDVMARRLTDYILEYSEKEDLIERALKYENSGLIIKNQRNKYW